MPFIWLKWNEKYFLQNSFFGFKTPRRHHDHPSDAMLQVSSVSPQHGGFGNGTPRLNSFQANYILSREGDAGVRVLRILS